MWDVWPQAEFMLSVNLACFFLFEMLGVFPLTIFLWGSLFATQSREVETVNLRFQEALWQVEPCTMILDFPGF
jgi:hypothetical protein